MANRQRLLKLARIACGIVVLLGVIVMLASFRFGVLFSEKLWGVEPLAYLAGVVTMAALGFIWGTYVLQSRATQHGYHLNGFDSSLENWTKLTKQYFELYHHDLGRPLTRILAKERELRAVLARTGGNADPGVSELLDEIERQAPNFRLMLANIQVLVELEAPRKPDDVHPVEPAQVVRRIVDRYAGVVAEAGKEITWWSEPSEFGMVYSDPSAIEHIITNLIDNASKYATEHIEVRLTKDESHFYIRVWDDGPGIAPHHVPHIFDRGWTPEVSRRDEKTSSGLGLFIARTLAARNGGDITVESVTAPDPDHHTAFVASFSL
ncbi:MAG: HAMP domain-containing histidine kinase [SAR202 cluster bacterium]|nr:HAMP domain-containing histidine kinase [SAR202 cluster bacterium]